MGKRKLHDLSFYQCDWTGLPMNASNCYMPSWSSSADKKLVKRGSYSNWESVLAHAQHRYDVDKQIETEELERIRDHVAGVVGAVPERAPHYSEMDYMGGHLSKEEFHSKCCYETGELTCVCIRPDGLVEEQTIDSNDGNFDTLSLGEMISPVRKASQSTLAVFYKGVGQRNEIASSIFKLKMDGEVTVLRVSKESCFMPRTRFVNYSLSEFNDEFGKKKRAPSVGMTKEEYGEAKKGMQRDAARFEANVSSGTLPPVDMSRVKKSKYLTGKQLADKAVADKLPGWEKALANRQSTSPALLADERA